MQTREVDKSPEAGAKCLGLNPGFAANDLCVLGPPNQLLCAPVS